MQKNLIGKITTMGLFDYFSKSPEKILGDYFDKAVMDAADSSGGNPMIAGVMIFSTIAQTYDSLKRNNTVIQKCGLSNSDYLQLLEKVLNKKGREYLSNWDQMREDSQRDYEDRYIDMDL